LSVCGLFDLARAVKVWPGVVRCQSEPGRQLAEAAERDYCSPRDRGSAKLLYGDTRGRKQPVGRDAGHLKIIAAALVAIVNNGEEAKERGDRLDSLGSLESSIACPSTALGLAPLGSKQAYLATLTQMPRELGRRGRCASPHLRYFRDAVLILWKSRDSGRFHTSME